MIIVMGKNASQESVEGVIGFIRNKGLKEHVSRGKSGRLSVRLVMSGCSVQMNWNVCPMWNALSGY